ncbi:hypothetical protein [Mycobacterium sp. NPDC050853]|uniref:hypothetical protein n=1 Tax=Mycobacterium sp. NPDC050853 TaxID=3155160 RepID=UPI0033D38E7B
MARFISRGGTRGVRAHLLADASEFRDWLVEMFQESGYSSVADALAAECSKPVDALAAGLEVSLHRSDLPDDHPDRHAGAPGDYLVLGVDDVLREL